jgi:hypothetical protein
MTHEPRAGDDKDPKDHEKRQTAYDPVAKLEDVPICQDSNDRHCWALLRMSDWCHFSRVSVSTSQDPP